MVNENYQHSWDVTPQEAIEIQQTLREKVIVEPFHGKINFIAGADISFNKYSEKVYAGIVVLKYPELVKVDQSVVISTVKFPYIPGFLSFREAPALLKALRQLNQLPDVMIMDGQGIAHPRRLGIASHFGLISDIPSIGCAKSVLTGTYTMPGNFRGDVSDLVDKEEKIGVVLRTRPNVKPVFISPGHKISFAQSVDFVLKCVSKYRLPETTRLAHTLVNQIRIKDKEREQQKKLFED